MFAPTFTSSATTTTTTTTNTTTTAPTTTAPTTTAPTTTGQDATQVPPHQYHLLRKLHDTEDLWLVERQADRHQFVAFRWDVDQLDPDMSSLLGRGAGEAVAALLNHPNLVSHIDLHQAEYWLGTQFEKRNYAISDYCDAGSLRHFIDNTPVLPVTRRSPHPVVLQWLPESLVWHVATSLLAALAWLHEGVRQEETIVWAEDGTATRHMVEDTPFTRGEDWFPLLHRDIRANQVFLQHPKGIETYGYCKLGGYGRVSVSGHVHGRALGAALASEAENKTELELKEIVAKAQADMVLAQALAEDDDDDDDDDDGNDDDGNEVWIENFYHLPKADRPYFKGTEAFQVGVLLYLLMTRQVLPDPEECPGLITDPLSTTDDPRPAQLCGVRHWEEATTRPGCPIWPSGVFRLDNQLKALTKGADEKQPATGYTDELLDLLSDLLGNYRRSVQTTELLMLAREGYLQWKKTTQEGRRHVDHWDDLVQRETNRRTKERANTATATRQSGPRALDYLGKPPGGVGSKANTTSLIK